MTKELAPLYWLWIPAIAMVIQIILEVSIAPDVLSLMHSEQGPHETLQALIIAAGLVVALRALFSKYVKSLLLKTWFSLAALACFYVTGEELSWGQHFWDWATPKFWSEINDQQETNLHNTSSWLDQKPRLLLEIGIVFGALIYPFLKSKGFLRIPAKLDFLMPSKQLRFIALLVIVPKILEKLFEAVDISIFVRFSEVQELYMFYFVLLYLIMLRQKCKKSENA